MSEMTRGVGAGVPGAQQQQPPQGGMNPGLQTPGTLNMGGGLGNVGNLGSGGAVDKSVVCPAMLVGKLIGPGGSNIKKMAQDTGAQINLDTGVQPGGGKIIVVTAPDPGTRE